MKRRTFAIALAGVLGGCASTGADTSTPPATDTRTPTETATSSPTPAPTETETETPIEANTREDYQTFLERHDAKETYVSENNVEYQAEASAYADYVRVYDSHKDEVIRVEPDYRWFFQFGVYFENLGGETVETPEITDFRLKLPTRFAEPIVDFPPGYDYDAMRSHPDGITFFDPSPALTADRLAPGDNSHYMLIFDIFPSDVKEMVLDITKAVESTEPVYLSVVN